jgi:hypothetical protein
MYAETLNEMKEAAMQKSLHYAYPGSAIADRCHAPKGCWFIKIGKSIEYIFPEGSSIDRRWEALRVFESLPNSIDKSQSFTRESTPFLKQ